MSTSTEASSRIVLDERERFGEWARVRIPVVNEWGDWYQVIGHEEDGVPIAAVVYNNFTGCDISMHVAATPGTRWGTSEFLSAVFAYPFKQLGVRRVSGYVPAKNLAEIQFDYMLGFKKEGVLRHFLPDDDMVVLGMLKSECRWING